MRSNAASGPRAADPCFGGKAGLLRGLDDQLRQPVAAAAVEPVGLRIFVDQPFELLLALVEAGAGPAAAADGRA